MSEYQFYEFRSIDRPLTAQEQQEIGRWSSRTSPTATGATFIYNYGDFPKNPKQVVGHYFDAMFYIANWGATWLMFRFPKNLLDRDAIQSYCTVDEISLSEHGAYVVLEMRFSDEDGYGWIDGEGYLSSLIGLRQDILKGDYRSLYLAWLHACSQYRGWAEFDPDKVEPVLSRRLTPFNGALKSLVDLVQIDQDLLSAVSAHQPDVTEDSQDITAALSLLSETEKEQFLRRLLNEEPLLSAKLRQRLQSLSTPSRETSMNSSRRTIGEIFQEAEQKTHQRQEAAQRKREEQHRQKLVKIEAEESTLWKNVSQHISEKKPKAYDAAILILKDLLLLAQHRGTQAEYEQHIQNILKEYPRLSSLKSKITRAKLLQK